MGSEECKACPLYQHFADWKVPDGAELAWKVYQKLTGPAVERFSLQGEAWRAMGLDLDGEDVDVLLEDLNEIEAGVLEARRQIEETQRKRAEQEKGHR